MGAGKQILQNRKKGWCRVDIAAGNLMDGHWIGFARQQKTTQLPGLDCAQSGNDRLGCQ
jgi:2-keto-4-pentenoate hydratase